MSLSLSWALTKGEKITLEPVMVKALETKTNTNKQTKKPRGQYLKWNGGQGERIHYIKGTRAEVTGHWPQETIEIRDASVARGNIWIKVRILFTFKRKVKERHFPTNER